MSSPFLCLWVRFPLGLSKLQFGEPSGWESFRSRLRPENVSPITQNFGWSATRRAGGEASGEIGGRIQKSAQALSLRDAPCGNINAGQGNLSPGDTRCDR